MLSVQMFQPRATKAMCLERREQRYLRKLENREIFYWDIPVRHRTPKINVLAVRLYYPNIWRIPEEEKTYETWLAYGARCGDLTIIPPEHVTHEMCLACVKAWPAMIQHVPLIFLDQEIIDAVQV